MSEQRVQQLEQLVQDYHTLLRVIHPAYWEDTMTPFWVEQKDKLQQRAQALLKDTQPRKAAERQESSS